MSKTPRFSAWKREVPLLSDRGAVMEALARELCCKPTLTIRGGKPPEDAK